MKFTSYSIRKYSNGIYELLINTDEKWLDIQVSESIYAYEATIYGENSEILDTITIESFLPNIDNTFYLRLDQQNKDQYSLYFIPFDRNSIKTSELIKNVIL